MNNMTRHETTLILLYRSVPIETRAAIDRALFQAWTTLPCSLDRDHPDTIRFRQAVGTLQAEHMTGRALSRFAAFWSLPPERQGTKA